MTKIPFKVSSRTARLIGRENVSNADGAVIELVKNSHDADAKNAFVLFGDNNDIYIIDNGHGMTEQAIQNNWMVIGTDNKEVNPFSPRKRVKAGAKGIGRFALDRLGEKVDMYTLPKGEKKGYHWSVNWSSFEKESTNVSDVKADLKTIPALNLKGKILGVSSAQKNKIHFIDGGTILHITDLRDNWDKEALEGLYKNLESLVPAIHKDSFSISLISATYPNNFGLVKPLLNDDFDYRIIAKYDSKMRQVKTTLERNELDLQQLQKRYNRLFLRPSMQESPYTLDDFKRGHFSDTYEIDELLKGFHDEDGLLKKIGDITFEFTFAKNRVSPEDQKKYPYKTVEYAGRSQWLKQFGGVKIFRDNFRVRPYGEVGDDWLQLGERQAASPGGPGQRVGGYKVGPNQVSGIVHISRVHNDILQDKSSREGIQENKAFYLLKEILLSVISLLEYDRNVVMYNLSEFYKETNQDELKKGRGRDAVNVVRQAVSGKNDQVDIDVASDIADANEVLESENKEKDEEIKILRSLASAGLITAAVAHELSGLQNILVTRNADLKKIIKPFINEEDLIDIKPAFNPYVLLDEMEQTDINLQEWLRYALMPLKRDRRKRRTIFLGDYFSQIMSTWENLLKERKIHLSLEAIDKSYSVKMFMIDLDTVFNNLIINSVESFGRRKERIERTISIFCTEKDSVYQINYTDNGAGLDSGFKKNPSEIFLPQKTSKRDKSGNLIGTGMGMYLVKSVMEENNGSVEILSAKEGFSLLLQLPRQ